MTLRQMLKVMLRPRRTHAEMIHLQDHLTEASSERDRLRSILDGLDAVQFVPPGHFYSPVPSRGDVESHLARQRHKSMLESLPAIRMDDQTQLDFLRRLETYYPKVPFQGTPTEGLLYHFDNPNYSYTDGIVLFCAMNHLRPRRLIEIGSGFSTCAILDTNRLSLGSQTQITSIEPHAELLRSLIAKSNDSITIVEKKLQDAELEVFDQLCAGDVLFIDSTHISKVGSDVNYIIFEILPRLSPGVIIQIHDIYLAYEYPDVWLREGRAWNEAYLLRAFLEYNERFRILLFVSYMQNAHEGWFREHMPDTLLNKGGCFWMEKI
ncbi:MAG TPA: class I SAM-dependent methyltransferase [Bryobacteraceae bacterium]|nr:class I SAM-dependent methyltransferase [Bryobacteraceae bacterium]